FRSDVPDVPRVQQAHRPEACRHLVAIILAEIIHVGWRGGDEKISLGAIARGVAHHFIESCQERDGVERHADVDGRAELRPHTAHALSGGPLSLMGFAFDHQHIAASRFGQVIRDTGADNPATDDDDIRGTQNAPPPERPCASASAILLNWRRNVYLGTSADAFDESGLTIFFHCADRPVPVCFIIPKGPRAQVVPVARKTLFRKSWLSVGCSFQVSPPSALIRKPSSVVIQPRLAPSKPIELNQLDNEVFVASQVTPPSLVRNSCPAKPTIQPFFAS